MSSSFHKGVESFKSGNLEAALQHFTEAIQEGSQDSNVNVYDSRAAVYEKLGKRKEALLDCKKVIELAPARWQGYLRSARLFLALRRFDRAKSMVSMAHARIKADDKKRIAEVVSLQEKIERDSATFAEQQAIHRSKTFYHFGKIPFEIAMMIFSQVLEENPSEVVRLAQVCKDWRATVLNAPALWRTLSLNHRNPARKAKAWKVRCHGVIEYLHLRGEVWPAYNILQEYDFTRLRGLIIFDVDPHSLCKNLPTLCISSVMSKLDSVDIQCGGRTEVLWMWEAPDTQLRHLSLNFRHSSWPSLAKNVKHLRTFTYKQRLEHQYFPHLRALLHGNEQLRSLDLTVDLFEPDVPLEEEVLDVPEVITMSHLESLTLTGRPPCVESLVTSLQLPRLRKLNFSTPVTSTVFEHFLSAKIGDGLTELRLSFCVFGRHRLMDFLKFATKLEHLQFTGSFDGDLQSLLDALTGASPDEIGESMEVSKRVYLCPSLKYLDLTGSPKLQAGPIVRLIKHRNLLPSISQTGEQVSKIETLIIDKCPLIDSNILPWLRTVVPRVSCVYMTKKEANWKR
ncbi:hypothetical protein QCA50_002506 [Cerrena zonata]|uniref:F-box domain-containing protein n=1 Tax=Cerrena zonata TaxID=2478898 RepID=A0AAW0GPB2_9APHY